MTTGTAAIRAWEAWRQRDPEAADAFADLWRGELEDAHARPDDCHLYLHTGIQEAQRPSRTFIVRADCDAYCRERWRVTIPADTPDDELRDALHVALDATGEFLDQDVDGEHNREIIDYEEEGA